MGSLFSTFTKIVCMVLMLLYCYSLFRNLSLDYGDGKRRLAATEMANCFMALSVFNLSSIIHPKAKRRHWLYKSVSLKVG